MLKIRKKKCFPLVSAGPAIGQPVNRIDIKTRAFTMRSRFDDSMNRKKKPMLFKCKLLPFLTHMHKIAVVTVTTTATKIKIKV